MPVSSNRERNLRNGFVRPLKLTLKTKLEACLHPAWLVEFMRPAPPMLSNWQAYAPSGASAEEVADFVTTQTPTPILWQDIESFRRLWSGKLVLKGIMHPDDATRAAAHRRRRHHGVEPRRAASSTARRRRSTCCPPSTRPWARR